MNIKQIIESSYLKLSENDVLDSMLKTKLVVSYVTTIPKAYLISHEDEELSKEQEDRINEYIDKISNGYPVQYITHEQYFRRLKLFVDDNVLIPQPDTEVLVDEAIKIIEELKIKEEKELDILDLCTGSGAIVLALANEKPDNNYIATDISNEALKIANKNAVDNNIEITFMQGDLFKAIDDKEEREELDYENLLNFIKSGQIDEKEGEKKKKELEPKKYTFDLIVSNPPYIDSGTIPKLPSEVQHEPNLALDGGYDGLEFYRRIAKDAKKYLNKGGYLAVEIGFNQKEDVQNIFKTNWFKNIYTVQDLAGNDRVVIAQVGEE